MRVRVKIAFRSYRVGQELDGLPDSTAHQWIANGLVEEVKPDGAAAPANKRGGRRK